MTSENQDNEPFLRVRSWAEWLNYPNEHIREIARQFLESGGTPQSVEDANVWSHTLVGIPIDLRIEVDEGKVHFEATSEGSEWPGPYKGYLTFDLKEGGFTAGPLTWGDSCDWKITEGILSFEGYSMGKRYWLRLDPDGSGEMQAVNSLGDFVFWAGWDSKGHGWYDDGSGSEYW